MNFEWQKLPSLPPAPGCSYQPGVAGPFAGCFGDYFVVGGGANFMDLPPWRGGKKSIHDEIFIMQRKEGSSYEWLPEILRLPHPLAYGVSFNTELGIVIAGGCDNERCYADVMLLRPTRDGRKPFVVDSHVLPPLPTPLAFMSGVRVGTKLYVAGGQTMPGSKPCTLFCMLDLDMQQEKERFQWEILASWPGPMRLLPVTAACEGRFYLASGRIQESGRPTTILTDFYTYDTFKRTWTSLSDVHGFLRNGQDGWSVMAGTASEIGGKLYFFGGSRGTWFMELEKLDFQIQKLRDLSASSGSPDLNKEKIAALLRRKIEIQEDEHPGFSREVLEYDPASDVWRIVAEIPYGSQVTTQAVKWGEDVIIPCGEIRPGIRTPDIWRISIN